MNGNYATLNPAPVNYRAVGAGVEPAPPRTRSGAAVRVPCGAFPGCSRAALRDPELPHSCRRHRGAGFGRQPRFPMFAESGFWKTQALAAKDSLRAWLRTHATGHKPSVGIVPNSGRSVAVAERTRTFKSPGSCHPRMPNARVEQPPRANGPREPQALRLQRPARTDGWASFDYWNVLRGTVHMALNS